MRLPGWIPIAVLVIAAAASSLALWLLYRSDESAPLIGPPRSDYFLVDFELISLNSEGQEAFRVSGPLLSRHPYLGTITIEQPAFDFPTANAEAWTARADRASSNANATEIKLDGNVALNVPAEGEHGAMAFHSESLTVRPRERRASSDDRVVFSSADSILQGQGLRIDMQSRRLQLLAKVSGNYATPHSTPTH
ncbi:MAG TPA: LPS export ABC transporter periplasmic protein LptC [Chiayiivirga sp.]|nr:LPS export ABC transporter periplasmic protein LptC [Chiayiivirga sp.]